MKKAPMFLGIILMMISACNHADVPPPLKVDAATSDFLERNQITITDDPAITDREYFATSKAPLLGKLRNRLDLNHPVMMRGNGVKIFIYPFRTNPTQSYMQAVSESGAGDEYVCSKIGNTFTLVKNQDQAVQIRYDQSGKLATVEDRSEVIALPFDFLPTKASSPFCQRKTRESFSTCFKRTADAFCDSAPSCIALALTPYPTLVIATACGCTAGRWVGI